MKAMLYERMGIISATALALAAVLAYSLWGAFVLHAQEQEQLSQSAAPTFATTDK